MATTLHDVARHSGVSIATVSRALAGSEAVAPATRDRVRRIAQGLGYVPNRAARQLVTGRGQSVALVLPDLENPYYAAVLKGVQQRARAAGWNVVVADTDEDPAIESAVVDDLGSGVDRWVLASPRMAEPDLVELAERVDLVVINRRITAHDEHGLPRVASIEPDNDSGIAQILQHLRALGHRRIGYAGGPQTSWSDQQRRAGCRRHSGGSVLDLGAFRPGPTGGARAGRSALEQQVTAIVAFNDQLAIGILAYLAGRGVSVAHEMSLVGFDDVPIASLLAPALTTVAVPGRAMGIRAVDLLLGADSPVSVREPVRLRVRDSTAPPRNSTVPTSAAPSSTA